MNSTITTLVCAFLFCGIANSATVLYDINGLEPIESFTGNDSEAIASEYFNVDLYEVIRDEDGPFFTVVFESDVAGEPYILAVKAGNKYAFYDINDYISGAEIYVQPFAFNQNGGVIDISHVTGYTVDLVPEPSRASLLFAGLWATLFATRRRSTRRRVRKTRIKVRP